MVWCHSLTGCVCFWDVDPVFFVSRKRVNPCFGARRLHPYSGKKGKPTGLVLGPVGCTRTVVKRGNPLVCGWPKKKKKAGVLEQPVGCTVVVVKRVNPLFVKIGKNLKKPIVWGP